MLLLAWALLVGASATVSAESVTLAWDPNPEPDIAGYTVYVGTSPGVYSQTFDVPGGATTTFTYNEVVPGQRYYFTVSAYNTANVSGPRAPEISWKLNVGPVLAQPANATGAVGAPAQLQLSATDDGDPLAYSASGLPAGLSVDASSGLISGTPTAQGVSTVTVTVSDGEFQASRSFTWTIGPALQVTSLGSSVASPQITGTAITFTATASGGVAPYQYKFFATVGSTTTVLRTWGSSASYTWTPALPGTFAITVWARSAGSTAEAAEGSLTRSFVINPPPLSLTSFTSSVPSPQMVTTSIVLTPTSTGGIAPHQYKYLVTSGGTTTVLRTWSPNASYTWTPTQPGSYVVTVWVRSAHMAGDVAEATGTLGFTITAAPADLVVRDNFDGSTLLAAHPPNFNLTGAGWVVTGALPAPTISGGVARVGLGTGHLQATISSGIADFVMSTDYRVGAASHLGALAFRLTDANNHLALIVFNNALELYRRQAGVYTQLARQAVGPIAAGSTHRLEVRAAGSTIQGWWDGALVLEATSTFQQGATRHGLDWNSAYDATATYDNFELRTPAPPAAPSAPASPTPAHGSSGVATSATLAWSSLDATSYDLRFGASNPPPAAAAGLAAASYTPGGLNASTTYYWQVVAKNAGGTTAGPVWSFTTAAPPPPPGVPGTPNPTNAASGVSMTPTLTWAAAGATSYDVRFGSANPPAPVAAGRAAASYTPARLAPDTTYYWQIVARNDGGTTAGPVWSFRTVDIPAGLLVSDTFSVPGVLETHQPDINLTGAPWVVTGAPPDPLISGGLARVGSGTGHVQATIASGIADFVMAADYRVGAAKHLGALAFRLTDADNHLLLVAYSNGLELHKRSGGVYSMVARAATPPMAVDTTHRLEVRATGATIEGWWDGVRVLQASCAFQQTATRHGLDWNSAFDTAAAYDNFELRTAAAPAPPSAPAAPVPAAGATGVATSASLAWTAAGATSYDVRFGTNNPPAAAASGLAAASYTPAGLAAGTKYYWQIVARNEGGTTTGPVWSFTTAAPPPPPGVPASPSPASAAVDVSTAPVLTWASAGATSYDVRLSTITPPALVASGRATASYTPAALAPGTTYYWQIVARNGSGATTGPVWSFTTADLPAGILVSDTFSESTSLPAHRPDVNVPGASWVVTGAQPTPAVSGAVAYVSPGTGHVQATLDAGVSDFVMAADYRMGDGPHLGALAFRLTDAANHLLLVAYASRLQLYECRNGVYTVIAEAPVAAFAARTTHRLEVRAIGSTLEGWWDGVRVVQATSTFQQSATRHGLDWNSAYDAGATYDNFELRMAGDVTPPAVPTAPYPANGAANAATNESLRWSATGAVRHDVYFGTSSPPPSVATDLATATYTPPALVPGTTYYWQIVVHNSGGSTSGPVWSFTTTPAVGNDVIVRDTFGGDAGTTLLLHAPDLNGTGSPWVVTGSSPQPRLTGGGLVGVTSGSGHLQATIDSGISDFTMAVDYRVGSGPQLGALAFRLTSPFNHLLLVAHGNALQFFRKENGIYIMLASQPVPAIAAGTTHRLEVRASGGTLEGWWDGVKIVQVFETFQQSATRHGLDWNSAYDPLATYDNFELRTR